mmetsp:Transcript_16687/g.29198  ORF Transcript_16687/g.29198 Transcript_16687/m.29198 type:complete len:258 (+) Transcript_16687:50-823(+)
MAAGAIAEPPLLVPDGAHCWVRTEVKKGADLVDGLAWIAKFEGRLKNVGTPPPEPGRRLLRQTLSDGDNPMFWGQSAAPNSNNVRNQVLKAMSAEFGVSPAKQVRLVTGHSVLFWFNVGPPGQMRDRVFVTDAHCPHQGVCLAEGELKDVEDLAQPGSKRGMIRCPRHNKTFDLQTGESPGNMEVLRVYPIRYEHGCWYVQVPADQVGSACQAGAFEDTDMEIDEPEQKRPRFGDPPTPLTNEQRAPRMLMGYATMG